MTSIAATVRGGMIVPSEPFDWPDGTEVEVSAVERDDETPDSPEEIARWLAAFAAIPTPVMTEEEWAAWERRRRDDREWELAHAEERAKKIQAGLE